MGRDDTVDYDYTIRYDTEDDDKDELRYHDLMNNLTESSLKLRRQRSALESSRSSHNRWLSVPVTAPEPVMRPGTYPESAAAEEDYHNDDDNDIEALLLRSRAVYRQNTSVLNQLASQDIETCDASGALGKLDLAIDSDPMPSSAVSYRDYLELRNKHQQLKRQYIAELDKSNALMKSFQTLADRKPVVPSVNQIRARLLKAKQIIRAAGDLASADDGMKQRYAAALHEIEDAESLIATAAGDSSPFFVSSSAHTD